MWAVHDGLVGWVNGPVEVRDGDRLVMLVADGESRSLPDVIKAAGGKTDGLTFVAGAGSQHTPDRPMIEYKALEAHFGDRNAIQI